MQRAGRRPATPKANGSKSFADNVSPSRPCSSGCCADMIYTRCSRVWTGARTGTETLKLPRNTSSSAAPSPPVPGSPNPNSDVGQTYPPLASKGPPQLANEWEFSGWGSVRFVELSADEIEAAARRRDEEKKRDGHETLGAWRVDPRLRCAEGPHVR